MIKCPSCGKNHPENTLFCDECGVYLLAEGQKSTASFDVEDVDWVETELGIDNGSGLSQARPMVLRATILDTGRQIELTIDKEVNIGRLDATSATFPEIDVTADQGHEKGVSRRHAKITRKGSTLYVEDLGSANGTFLNDRRLTPFLPHILQSDDQLRLSKLNIRLQFD